MYIHYRHVHVYLCIYMNVYIHIYTSYYVHECIYTHVHIICTCAYTIFYPLRHTFSKHLLFNWSFTMWPKPTIASVPIHVEVVGKPKASNPTTPRTTHVHVYTIFSNYTCIYIYYPSCFIYNNYLCKCILHSVRSLHVYSSGC